MKFSNFLYFSFYRLEEEHSKLQKMKDSFDSNRNSLLATMKEMDKELESLRRDSDSAAADKSRLRDEAKANSDKITELQKKVEELEEAGKELAKLKDDSAKMPWEDDEDLKVLFLNAVVTYEVFIFLLFYSSYRRTCLRPTSWR